MKIRLKETLRLILNTKAYFLTLVLVTCFGVLTYTGISFSTASLVDTCEDYYDDYHFYDLQISSLYGFSEQDLDTFRRDSRVSQAESIFQTQALIRIDSNEYVADFFSRADTLNTEKLQQGHFPEKKDECLIEQALADRFGLSIGDTIQLASDDHSLARDTFTIVGTADLVTVFVSDDFYNRGISDLGDGQVSTKILLTDTAFSKTLPRQVCYVTMKNRGVRGSDSYDRKSEKLEQDLLAQAKEMGKSHRATKKDKLEKKLAWGKQEYEQGKNALDQAKALIAKADKELPAKRKELSSKEAQVEKAREALEPLKQTVDKADAILAFIRYHMEAASDKVNHLKEQLEKAETEEERSRLQAEYESALATYNTIKYGYDLAESSRDKLYSKYSSSKAKVDKAQSAVSSARSQISRAESEVADAREKVRVNEPRLEEAEKEIRKAEKKLKNLPKSRVFTSNIHDNASYNYYVKSIEGTNTVTLTLSILLMVIGLLVCMTTISRMVTEQHRFIGTQKALGFRNSEIRSKYIMYAFAATLIGVALGVLASYTFFEKMVFRLAYGKCFIIDHFTPMINWTAMAVIFLVEVLAMGICAWLSCRQMLSRSAIDLLNSNIRSGKQNKRKFTGLPHEARMVLRNLKSNPQILVTTLVSVFGCTAILIIALTVYHGMSGVSDMQYHQLQQYQGTLTISTEAKEEDKKELTDFAEAAENVDVLPVVEHFIPFQAKEGKEYATLLGLKQSDDLRDFLKIRDAETGKALKVPEDGVLICNRIAETNNLKTGDELVLYDSMGKEYKTTIRGVFERYVGLALIADGDYYADLMGKDISMNQYYVRGSSGAIRDFCKEARGYPAFCNYSDAAYFEEEMDFKVRCVTMILLVVLTIICILSLIVIFDLVQMNIQKKEKEIVVMKILGYPKKKIYGYVFWESMLICLIGLLLGVIVGGPLGSYISRVVEMENLQYIRGISAFACVAGGLINLMFCTLSNLLALRGIRRVKMTGSAREA